MITIPISDLEARAKVRPEGYRETVLAAAWRVTETDYTLSDEAYERLKYKYRSKQLLALESVDEAKWSMLVRMVAKLRAERDKGIGDTLQRVAAKAGGELYKRLMKRLGLPCKCTDRQSWLNLRYPYRETQ